MRKKQLEMLKETVNGNVTSNQNEILIEQKSSTKIFKTKRYKVTELMIGMVKIKFLN